MSDPTDAARLLDASTRRPQFARWSRGAGALLLTATLSLGMIAAASPARAAAPAYFCDDNTQPYVPVSEVESWTAGHAVTGKTVVSGTDPTGFTGEYIGHIDDFLGKGKDVLLFKFSSPTIDGTNGLKAAGIWQGMSGSPVYDGDGRLIGAVAYGFNPDNLPIAGVTPAEYMKNIGTTGVSQPRSGVLTAANLKISAAGARIAQIPLEGTKLSQVKTVRMAGPAGGGMNKFTNRTLARTPRTSKAASMLRGGGFAAAPKQAAETKPLVAGGNLAASLTSGDLSITATGTVTAICGSTVWGFGHPLLFDGKTTVLFSNASAAMIIPDATGIVGSYKEVTKFYAPAGVITQDRLAGVRGTLGATTGFPLTVNVKNSQGKPVDSYHAKVAYPDAAAAATAQLVGRAAMEQLDQYGAGTGELTWTIKYRRANGKDGKLVNSQVISDRSYFPDEIATPPADDVWAITQQSHEKVTITGVTVAVKLLSADAIAYRLAKVQRLNGKKWVSLSASKLRAGTRYQLRPMFQVLNNNVPVARQPGSAFSIRLSKNARTTGSVKLLAASESAACVPDKNGEPDCGDWSSLLDKAKNFDQLIALLKAQPSNAAIVGMLRYKLTKGSSLGMLSSKGPGVVKGNTGASFTIKK